MGNTSSTEDVPIIAMKQDVEDKLLSNTTDDPEKQPRASRDSGECSEQPLLRELADYHLEKKVLGEGAFAKVRLATSASTGHAVAVKIIKRKKLNARCFFPFSRLPFPSVPFPWIFRYRRGVLFLFPFPFPFSFPCRTEELLQREVKHHERLRHENIVRLRCSIMTPTKYYLVMEFCPRGDLLQFVNSTGHLPDCLARSLFRGLMSGISFCHSLGICHRDLKLENIMLQGEDDDLKIKIADFGLSVLQAAPGNLSGTFCGSPLYAAPELMTDGASPDGYDASKSDIWSCGVILPLHPVKSAPHAPYSHVVKEDAQSARSLQVPPLLPGCRA